MKALFSGSQKQRVVIFTFLMTFLFSGIGVVSGLPIFFTALAHSHPVFFSVDKHKIRLILHHPGNHDVHETDATEPHQHDLLDAVFGVPEKDDLSHGDHEVEISASDDAFSTSTKTQLIPTAQSLLSVIPNDVPVFPREQYFRFSGLSPPPGKASHLSLRSTILII